MNYREFKHSVQNYPIILSRDMVMGKGSAQGIRNQFRRWQDKGLLIRLKKGVYILANDDRKVTPSRVFIANQLYAPSYVSLEYAFNFYGLIPERVSDVTSITTRKTASFYNEFGKFNYQHIKPQAYRGFRLARDEQSLSYFIAEPEKAVVDFLYLNRNRIKADFAEIFRDSFRFQNTESLKQKKIIEYASLFASEALNSAAAAFCQFLKEEKSR
jgi:predicted transcriptional regulator of viral defense system